MGRMDEHQILTITLASMPSTLAVLVGILINNSKLGHTNARISDTNARIGELVAIWIPVSTT